jgi:para-nitrobenzyl esterase
MIVCSTVYERSPSAFDSSLEEITLEKAKELAKTMRGFGPALGDNASEIIEAYAKSFPDRKPIEILAMVLSNRKNAIELCNLKSKQAALYSLHGSAGILPYLTAGKGISHNGYFVLVL